MGIQGRDLDKQFGEKMAKTIIIPDVHHKWDKVKRIFDTHPDADHYVFLGDYFDDFGDNIAATIQTAENVKQLSQRPNVTMLLGNHDLYYISRYAPIQSSGYAPEKHAAINKVMTSDDWNRLPLYTYRDGFYMSHAGFHPAHHVHPVLGFDSNWIKENADKALSMYKSGIIHPWMDIGMSRGGIARVGGLVWQDWDRDFSPIEGVNQIVGHTPHSTPQQILGRNSENYDLDTHMNHYGILQDGHFKTQAITWLPFESE